MALSSTFLSSSGSGYEAQMGRWSRRLAPLLIDFSGIREGSVVDVGCGIGSLTFALAQNPAIASVTGIDFSAPYVEHAKTQNRDHPRVALEVGDACAMPFPDGSFDHSISSLVIQFIPDGGRAVREMRRVTRRGGTVAAATWDVRGGFVPWRMFFDTASMLDPNAAERRAKACARPLVKREGLLRAWMDAGLAEVEVDALTIRMDFSSFDDFWTPHEGSDGPFADYLRTLEPDLKQKVREAVRAAYLDGEANGARSYAATAWCVKGTVS
ncbi:SAM-dependent methyltransferase [Bradyrhizobium sp. i1.8.4]|uniref:class I SAM-dependent methyltransferase n=1 Tax=unclassified Bradyrhizobium TaxID=2631580 RepID=UPI003D200182